jgi:hypothetical protein
MEPTIIIGKPEKTGISIPTQFSSSPPDHQPPAAVYSSWIARGRRRRALVWGIISTVLSAIGLIGLAAFEQYNGMLSELRGDLKHFNETSSDYVKRDMFQRCWERVRECTKEANASKRACEVLDRELKASEAARQDLAKELRRLRERLAYLEGMKAARPGPDSPPIPRRSDDPEDD